jgi:hypothetical protein
MKNVPDNVLLEIEPAVAEKTGLTSALGGGNIGLLREAVAAASGQNEINGFGLRLLAHK